MSGRLLFVLVLVCGPAAAVAVAQQPLPPAELASPAAAGETPFGPLNINLDELKLELLASAVRLPVAALLGTALALRPRRRGTPARQPAVVQTQIVLAVVGALIMLVVGASLARAFGIVGAANLIRYRSKIDDPKDAVVMLCALSVGLAAGVGLYGLAVVRHAFPRAGAVGDRKLRAADARVGALGQARRQDRAIATPHRGGAAPLQGSTTNCAVSRRRRSRIS